MQPASSCRQRLAKEHGTPLFVVDHAVLRQNYARFKRLLPRVQAYYAVKANPDPAIVKTLYEAGASFDVASMPEFLIVYENIKSLPAKARQDFIWDKIIYANPIKANETLRGARPLQAAGDLRQPGGDRQDSPATRPMPAWRCGSACPIRGPWSSSPRSSAPPPARRST